jgi:methyl-accepting chemotaxis protein
VAKATAEQAAAVEQIARATEDMRGRARDIVGAISQQGRRAAAVAQYVEEVASQVARITRANGEQTSSMSAIATVLTSTAESAKQP